MHWFFLNSVWIFTTPYAWNFNSYNSYYKVAPFQVSAHWKLKQSPERRHSDTQRVVIDIRYDDDEDKTLQNYLLT